MWCDSKTSSLKIYEGLFTWGFEKMLIWGNDINGILIIVDYFSKLINSLELDIILKDPIE